MIFGSSRKIPFVVASRPWNLIFLITNICNVERQKSNVKHQKWQHGDSNFLWNIVWHIEGKLVAMMRNLYEQNISFKKILYIKRGKKSIAALFASKAEINVFWNFFKWRVNEGVEGFRRRPGVNNFFFFSKNVDFSLWGNYETTLTHFGLLHDYFKNFSNFKKVQAKKPLEIK